MDASAGSVNSDTCKRGNLKNLRTSFIGQILALLLALNSIQVFKIWLQRSKIGKKESTRLLLIESMKVNSGYGQNMANSYFDVSTEIGSNLLKWVNSSFSFTTNTTIHSHFLLMGEES